MSMTTLAKTAGKTISKKTPVILTVAGCFGLAATVYTAVKSEPKYEKIVAATIHQKTENGEVVTDLTTKEKFFIGVRAYAPTIILGTATLISFITANYIQHGRLVGATAAATIASTAYKEFKDSVAENVTDDVREKIERSFADKQTGRVTESMKESTKKHIDDTMEFLDGFKVAAADAANHILFIEPYTNQPFYATADQVKLAVEKINRMKDNGVDASVNDFTYYIEVESGWKMEETKAGRCLGWRHTSRDLNVTWKESVYKDHPCFVLKYNYELDYIY